VNWAEKVMGARTVALLGKVFFRSVLDALKEGECDSSYSVTVPSTNTNLY
jgi:hypothetical protein